MSIYQKFNTMRLAFHKLPLKKTGYNDHNKSRFFQIDDFIKQSLQLCDEHGFCPLVSFSDDSATLTFIEIETGKSIVFNSPFTRDALPKGTGAQNLGAAQTYIRRYLWAMAWELVEQDEVEQAQTKEPVECDSGLLDEAEMAAGSGTEFFRGYWKKLNKEKRHQLNQHMDSLKAIAKRVDDHAAA